MGTHALRQRLTAAIRLLRSKHLMRGYTLIEMLVVLTIISMIVGLVGPRVLGYLGQSRVKTARLQIESLSSALDLFYMDAGRYPTGAEGLDALAQRPPDVESWNGPYLKGSRVPLDPWGTPITIACSPIICRPTRSSPSAPTAARAARTMFPTSRSDGDFHALLWSWRRR
jgi:type II secretion system protein G